MIVKPEIASAAFADFVREHHAPTVMQILPSLDGGGVEQGVIDINAAIVKAGGRSIVISSGGKRVPEIARGGGTHIRLPVHSKNPLIIAANILRLRKIIRAHNVDIVHACSRAPAWSAGRAVRGTQARYVTSVHSAHKIENRFKRIYNAATTKGELVMTVSHFLAEHIERNYGVDPAKVRVVHRGVALSRFHPNSVTPEQLIKISSQWRVPDGAPVILLPARLSRLKGHMFLIDALRDLPQKDFFCLFVGAARGNGSYHKELEKYIDDAGLAGKARIVSPCDDMPAAYMLSTVVVAPSLEPEGFGRVAIEAQAMGRPLIATDHGGAQETVIADETGWLVPPGDVPALGRALKEALALDANQRAKLATRAMSHIAKNFTNENMAAGTLDVYAEVLNMPRAQALPSNDAAGLLDDRAAHAG
ncbi:MAG: glycosyltransferase family 4 protein [Alphaproteobacteria bacterium]|nr:glycosyltransferase family 4 protein [Alphaproteobacteria bacterium]MDE2336997.1 glycosyltransferase family 4 protein [Alphaproteobacteria bacterium]